jgi:hypothetical protein
MFNKKLGLSLYCAMLAATPTLAKPPSFVDDLVTTATYDVNSMREACTTGVAAKWMVFSIFEGEIDYEQLIVRNGTAALNTSKYMNSFIAWDGGSTLIGRVDAITPAWHGLGLSGKAGFPVVCMNEPLTGTTNMPYTDDDICIYGGYSFNQFELTFKDGVNDGYGYQFGPDFGPGFRGVDDDGNGSTDDDANCADGPDGAPGYAGVDDDGNGTTDEINERYFCACGLDPPSECSGVDDVLGPNGLNQSQMRRAGEYLTLGSDGCPGTCGVDDDGNGITDWLVPVTIDYDTYDDDQDGTTDEIGAAGVDDNANGVTDEPGEADQVPDLGDYGFGDDSDDITGEVLTLIAMRANVGSITALCLMVDASFNDGQFQMQDVFLAQFADVGSGPDEIGPDFYQANQHYSYAFCASGSCYGAQLWLDDDIANPVETVGPGVNTEHLDKNTDNEMAVIFIQAQSGLFTPFSNKTMSGNKYLGDQFWIIQGPPGEEDVIVGSDRDADFDVDGVDFSVFASCFNKAGNPPRTLGCSATDAEAFDADGDGDVDGVDFSRFASCFNKAGNPPRAAGCLPNLTACP